jgi:hypothetical protein
MALPTKKRTVQVGSATFTFICNPLDGEYLDTTVQINSAHFCAISYSDQENFINELHLIIAKYAI